MRAITAAAGECIAIESGADVLEARARGRSLAERVGFAPLGAALVVAAITELARNIVAYAGRGEIRLEPRAAQGRRGIRVVARDEGPGIPDPALALQDGFSTSGGQGLGLPGVRRVMDEFELRSKPGGSGTSVTVTKWIA